MTNLEQSQPRISVVLPVYNGERYLRSCISSVLEQTLQDFELVIGDDCSKDDTRSIIQEFSDLRIRSYFFSENVGQFGNLNRLLNKTRASLIHFLCHDDTLNSHCLAEEVAFYEDYPDVVMSISQAVYVDAQDRIVAKWDTRERPDIYDTSISLQRFLFDGCWAGSLSSVCIRRTSFDRVGGFKETMRLSGDYEMWVRICGLGAVGELSKGLIRVRKHADQLSRSARASLEAVRENREIRRSLLSRLPHTQRSYARRYVYLRQNVLDTHNLMTSIWHGRFGEALEQFRIMGIVDVAAGLIAWLFTVNNHVYRPAPRFEPEQVTR